MLFYKIEATIISEEKAEAQNENERKEKENLSSEFAQKSEKFFAQTAEQCYVFASEKNDEKYTFGAVTKKAENIQKVFQKYIKDLPVKTEQFSVEETTLKTISNLFAKARRNDYINDDDVIMDTLGIRRIGRGYESFNYGENVLENIPTKNKLFKSAQKNWLTQTLTPELERIYMGKSKIKAQGHPVHYLISIDDTEIRKEAWRILISALYANKRIKSKRYCYVDFSHDDSIPDNDYDSLYKSCENGTVIVRYNFDSDDEFQQKDERVIKALCDTARKYRNSVLTIFALPTMYNEIKDSFLLNMNRITLVELFEDNLDSKKILDYLKNRAIECKLLPNDELFAYASGKKGYKLSEVNNMFDKWYNKNIKNVVFPQYKDVATAIVSKQKKEKTSNSNAYKTLQNLIGLEKAKKVIDQALNYHKAQKLFEKRGIKSEKMSMHMIFTGNPGTAKTTVARLFAQIMKESGIIENGNLYEVGRGDLVGKYTGHTAPLVQSAFKKAKGGVLFIDEAYSLVDDRDGSFGDEAINTIVQEMENNREDTIVIFAGYPDKMESFLNKNPGLRSRITFHVPFDDYDEKELCEIAVSIAKSKGLTLTPEALSKLNKVFCDARKQNDFGNGRYVRNVIEKAKMAQANRIVNMDVENISDNELVKIYADDIEFSINSEVQKAEKRAIGF